MQFVAFSLKTFHETFIPVRKIFHKKEKSLVKSNTNLVKSNTDLVKRNSLLPAEKKSLDLNRSGRKRDAIPEENKKLMGSGKRIDDN